MARLSQTDLREMRRLIRGLMQREGCLYSRGPDGEMHVELRLQTELINGTTLADLVRWIKLQDRLSRQADKGTRTPD